MVHVLEMTIASTQAILKSWYQRVFIEQASTLLTLLYSLTLCAAKTDGPDAATSGRGC
jgi:hypothetical protein